MAVKRMRKQLAKSATRSATDGTGWTIPSVIVPLALLTAVLLGVSRCGPPPPPPPTLVNAQVNATPDVNASATGQGNPISLRVYQLGSKSSFEGAEFYKIYSADAATLGPDLLKKDEFVLTPGGSKTLALSPTDQVKAIGVFGAYANFQAATWRATADVPAHATTNLVVTADKAGIKIVAKPAAP